MTRTFAIVARVADSNPQMVQAALLVAITTFVGVAAVGAVALALGSY